jgi:hypothetical protein
MCARRVCGCGLRRSRLLQLTLAVFAILLFGGTTATTAINTVVNAILIATLLLTAGMVAVVVVQVRHGRQRAMPARRATIVLPASSARTITAQPNAALTANPVRAITAQPNAALTANPMQAIPALPYAAEIPDDNPGRHVRRREVGSPEPADARGPAEGARLRVPY